MFNAVAIRRLAYSIELLLCFILQGSMGIIPEMAGCKPALLICCCVTISYFEGYRVALVYAVICGLLTDIASGTLAGPAAVTLAVLCFVLSRVFESYFRINLISGVLCGTVCIFAVTGVLFLAGYGAQGYGVDASFFANHYLWGVLYTCILLPLFYFVNKAISGNMKKTL